MNSIDLVVGMIKELHSDVKTVITDLKVVREEQLRQSFHISKNTKDLEYHIKRTDLLEEDVNINKVDIEDRMEVVEKPMKVMKTVVRFTIKSSAILGGIFTVILGIYKLIEYL